MGSPRIAYLHGMPIGVLAHFAHSLTGWMVFAFRPLGVIIDYGIFELSARPGEHFEDEAPGSRRVEFRSRGTNSAAAAEISLAARSLC